MKANSGKVRATAHRGRAGKYGAYNPKHNDRNYTVGRSEHIDPDKSIKNTYWHCFRKTHPEWTFEDAEKHFYEKHFSEALKQKNERYIKNRHRERVQTMDEYRTSERYCPEEIIFQLGTLDQNRTPSRLLWDIVAEYLQWQKSLWYDKRNEVKIIPLDMALHRDEQGGDHVHLRMVWMVKNSSGFWEINQEETLKRIGVERNDTGKERGRYNNRKKTFTQIARNKFIDIAKAYGVQIEEEPKEISKNGLSLLEYKAKQEQSRLEKLYFEYKCLETDHKHLEIEKSELEKQLIKLKNNPALKQPKAYERDEYVKEFHPHIWDMANDYVAHNSEWAPPSLYSRNRYDMLHASR